MSVFLYFTVQTNFNGKRVGYKYSCPQPLFSPLYAANTGKRFYSGIAKVVFISILPRNEAFLMVHFLTVYNWKPYPEVEYGGVEAEVGGCPPRRGPDQVQSSLFPSRTELPLHTNKKLWKNWLKNEERKS